MTIYTIGAALGAAIFFISTLILIPVVWLMNRRDSGRADRWTYPLVMWGFRMIRFGAGVKVHVIGRENIPKDRPVLFACNHRSIFDIIIGAVELPRPFVIIAKKELGKIPLLHFWMVAIHCFFLDRDDIKSGLEMVNHATECLKTGKSVFIFPEGTRSKEEGKFGEFKSGSLKPAVRAGAPVVPVTMVRTGDIFEDHMLKIYNREIFVVFGEPIDTATMPVKERRNLAEKVQAVVEENYRKYDPGK